METHMCACWMNEACIILSAGKIIKKSDGSEILGYMTACGEKIYIDKKVNLKHPMNLENRISDCLPESNDVMINGYEKNTTIRGKPIICFECKLLGSLEL